MAVRIETDSMGSIGVPDGKYWGAQTQRALENFKVGNERLPREFIRALGIVKKACAQANMELGVLVKSIGNAIIKAADEVIEGKLDDHFPLGVWQMEGGTAINMNANEVISNRATEILRSRLVREKPIHPNDHVNKSQSSNDVFPTAIQLCATEQIYDKLVPALKHFKNAIDAKIEEFADVVKIGRTDLQDATPLTLGQEFSAYSKQLELGIERAEGCLKNLFRLPLGGTAIGTGLNAPIGFDELSTRKIADITNLPFIAADNKFEGLAAHDVIVEASGVMRVIAVGFIKIANDIRWLSCGPRCGIGELTIPANEPGSSIMPGKVNPTQCDTMIMVAIQVLGNDVAIGFAGSQGNFELNAFKPIMVYNLLQSIGLLANTAMSFTDNCVVGIKANEERIAALLHNSLMLVTALDPHIGYDKSAKIVYEALEKRISLKESAVKLGYVSAEEFDRYVRPKEMVKPGVPTGKY